MTKNKKTKGKAADDNNNELTHRETILGVIFFAGLLLAAILWWSGTGLGIAVSIAFLFMLAGGLLVFAVDGFNTGKIAGRGGVVERDKNPIAFWFVAIFYLVASCGFFSFLLSLFFS